MRRLVIGLTTAIGAAIVIAACSQPLPVTPTAAGVSAGMKSHHEDTPAGHNSAADGDKGYIKGWYNGGEVELFYTKSYYCQEPPDSAAPTGCEIGEDAITPPRPGPIPTIYAIAAAGIANLIDPLTLSCAPGTTCLNHPLMIDASRVIPNAFSIGGVPHSHIVTEPRAGWFHTVNIRVRDAGRWNQIAAAKTIDKVRELQADGSGLVSPDTPTNLYFFIASWR
jgi:hypothetical protein